MKMLMLTERVCGSELLTIRRPLSSTVLSNIKVPEVYGFRYSPNRSGPLDGPAASRAYSDCALIVAHRGLEAPRGIASAARARRSRPQADAEPGQIRRAQRRRLLDRGHFDRHAQQVGLKLHQEGVGRAAAVDLQHAGWAGRPRAIASARSRDWIGDALQRGARHVRARGAARQADQQAARVHVPVRRAQPDERGHEVHAAVVGHGLGQCFGLGRVGDEPSPSRSHCTAAPVTNALPSSA